jgi:hypothetical protein
VLAKYQFQGRKMNPFVEVGPSFRTAGNLNTSDPSHHGLTAGTGFETNWRSLKIAPTVRYTLWAGDRHQSSAAQTAPDQLEILVKFSREAESSWRPLGRHISLGFTAGTNLNGGFRTTNIGHEGEPPAYVTSGPRSFIYGPKVEIRLPRRLSLEVNALHRPVSRATETSYEGRPSRWTSRSVTWVFPVLVKYGFAVRGLEPFVAVGPSFRLRQTLAEAADASPYGITAATGLETRVGPMRITPAIRYTHWAPDRRDYGGPFRNQAEGLVGFSF